MAATAAARGVAHVLAGERVAAEVIGTGTVGGRWCGDNRLVLTALVAQLEERVRVLTHRRVPANDGGRSIVRSMPSACARAGEAVRAGPKGLAVSLEEARFR